MKKQTYNQWRSIFDNHLHAVDMPLICPTGIESEELLQMYYRQGAAPQRAAALFNTRFDVASQAKSEAAQ